MGCFIHIDEAAARRAGVEDGRRLAETVAAMDRAGMSVLKDDPARSAVYRAELGGRAWVWKIYRRQRWWKRWARISPAWREWRAARRAAGAAGVRASVPIALATLGGGEQALLLPFVEGEALHQFVRRCGDRAVRLRVAEAVGSGVAALLAGGLVNRDHKLSNLIADAACLERGAGPVMIDPLGLQRRRGERQVMRMWATLLRTTLREGPISVREGLTCLRAGCWREGGGVAKEARRIRRAAGLGGGAKPQA